MLNLQAGIHFHEIELHAAVGQLLDDELDCPRADIVHSPRSSHRRFAHLLAHRVAQAGGGRFFQHLLMTTLYRTVTLKQIHIVAMGVAKHLNLNMPGPLRVLFHQQVVVAKAADGFTLA